MDPTEGLNLTDPVLPSEINSPAALSEEARQKEIGAINAAEEQEQLGTWHLLKNVGKETLTGSIIDNLRSPGFESDPTFTLDAFTEAFKEAQKEIPEHMLSDLHSARSKEEFDWLLNRARGHLKAQMELGRAGWGIWTANLMAQMLDPASLAVGLGTGSLAIKGGRTLLKGGRAAQLATNAVGGGAGGAAVMALMDDQGLPVQTHEYVIATALGMSLGAVFGPLGRNPATQLEAYQLNKIAEDLRKTLDDVDAPAQPQATSQAGVKRAEAEVVAEEIPAAPEAPEAVPGATPENAPEPVAPGADPAPVPAPEAAPDAPPFDPHAFSTSVVLKRFGENALRDRLREMTPDQLRQLARAQNLGGLPQGEATRDQLMDAVVAGTHQRLRDRYAAASGSDGYQDAMARGAAKEQPSAVEKAVEDVQAAMSGEPVDPVPSVQAAIKETLTGPAPEKPAPEKPAAAAPKAGALIDEPEVAMKQIDELETLKAEDNTFGTLQEIELPKHLKNDNRNIAMYRAPDGAEYKIVAEDDLSGPYKVVQSKVGHDGKRFETVRDLPTLRAARAAIPGHNPALGEFQRAAMEMLKPLPGKIEETPDGYVFRSFRIVRQSDDGKVKHFTIHKNGDELGEALGEMEIKLEDGRWKVSWFDVYDKGTPGPAYGLFKTAEREVGGGPVLPDGSLSADSYPMWGTRLPWVRDWYRQVGNWWLSPRRLLVDRHLLQQDLDLNAKTASKKSLDDLQRKLAQYDEIIASLPKEALDPRNLKVMFARFGDDIPTAPLRQGVREIVQAELDRILPKGYRGIVVDRLTRNGEDFLGLADPIERVVRVSLKANDPLNTVYHEGVHALHSLGLFRDDWAKLVKYVRDNKLHDRYMNREWYSEFYRKQGATQEQIDELLDEEAIAFMAADYLRGARFGKNTVANRVFKTTFDILNKIAKALGARGFRTVEDILEDYRSGAIAQRAEGQGTASFEKASARVDRFLDDVDNPFTQVTDENAPRMGGFWRFDNAGRLGHSENAPARILGGALLNDTVGKADHSLNPFSADLDYRRIMNVYMGEYDRTRRVAFQNWADDLGLSPAERWTREHEFYETVGDFIRDRNRQLGDYHPAVEQLGSKVATLHRELLEDLKNPLRREGLEGRPVAGSENVPEDLHYLWRKFNDEKVRSAIGTPDAPAFGQNGVEKMIANAILSAQPGIDANVLGRLARGYVQNIHRRASGMTDDWTLALSENNMERFRTLLREEATLTDQEADAIIDRLMGPPSPEGNMPNLKRRVFIDETYVERDLPFGRSGETRDLAFADLLDRNVNNLFTQYTRRVAGRVALGRVRIQLPDGTQLVNGITSDAEFERILKSVQQWGVDRGQYDSAAKAVERLRFAYDRIRGVPDPRQMGEPAQWLRLIRSYMATRLMGQVGIAQIGESGTIVGNLGVRAAFSHVPGFRRIIDAAGDTRLRNPLFDELESMGIGVERLHGMHFHNLDEVGELPFTVGEKPGLERAVNIGKMAERATYEASGMSFIQQQQERWVAAAMAQRIANMAGVLREGGRLGRGDTRRLAQLGIDEAMLRRILDQMRRFSDDTEGPTFGRRLNRLNVNQWTDLPARAAFEDALFRTTRKLVQAGDEGSMAFWMSNPIAQTIFQFRGFGFTAWANQFQYGIHMGDFRTLMAFTTAVAWNAAVRGVQVKLIAAARSDRESYEEKHLSAWELGKAGFQRGGWSSIIPMGIDTALSFAGQPGMFNARSSGQASSTLLGSPAISFLDNAAKGVGGLVDSAINSRSPSQAELRALAGMLPFSNLMPISMGLSALISDLPERSPIKQPSW